MSTHTDPTKVVPLIVVGRCALHGETHTRPRNFTTELHHVIPVAWQLAYRPPVAPFPGRDIDGRGMLWDIRTVQCAPSCHRNVHALIVRLMEAIRGGRTLDQAVSLVGDQRMGRGMLHALAEFQTATLALDRFAQQGGDLAVLAAAGNLGVA